MRFRYLVPLACVFPFFAKAAPVTYDFTGTITQVGTRVLTPVFLGEHIPISLTLEAAYPATPPGSGSYGFNGLFDPNSPFTAPILAANFNNTSALGLFQIVTVRSGESFSAHTTSPQVGAGFDLSFTGASSGALASNAIPLSLNPADFQDGVFAVTQAFSPTTYGYSGTIDGLAVPEPMSLAMFGMGMLAIGATRRRVAIERETAPL